MPDTSTLALFSVASLALLIVPGPAVLYIVTRSIDQGRTGVVFMLLGMCSDGLYAMVASSAGNCLRGNAHFAHFRRYFSGGIFVTLGVAAALSGSRSTLE